MAVKPRRKRAVRFTLMHQEEERKPQEEERKNEEREHRENKVEDYRLDRVGV